MVKLGSRKIKSRDWPSTIVTLPISYHLNGAGGNESQFSPAYPNLTTDSRGEVITYTTKRKTERFKSNWCNHLRYRQYFGGNPLAANPFTVIQAGAHLGHVVNYYYGHKYSYDAHVQALTNAYDVSQLNIAAIPAYRGDPQADINAHYVEMQPDLTEISLPNFLLELDDVPKLFELWKKNLSLSKNVAGAYLNYNFGWRPTFGDIKTMLNIFKRTRDKLKFFEQNANKVITTDKTFKKEEIVKSGTFNLSGDAQSPVIWSGSVKRSWKVGLTYQLQPMKITGDYIQMLNAYMDALGFELNPRIIWDALPFTFVLDWFFDVGGWLQRHKNDTLHIPFIYKDAFVSFKESYTVMSTLKMNQGSSVFGGITEPSWVTTRDFYARIPVAPSEQTFAGLGWRNPTGKQWSLLVALASVLSK